MKLKPVLKDAIWGGQRLAAEYNKSSDPNKKIAESWELTIHKNGVNIIENGEYAGQTLEEVVGPGFHARPQNPNSALVSWRCGMEAAPYNEKFPLLIKFIDAEQNLSVQVHPDDDYAGKYENGELGKTEMWYIIDAKPGAKIVYGLNGDYTREDLQNLIDNNRFEECLNYIEVKPGDVYFIPAGLVHAIGEGILIAEVQQNSDTTYRFYDYNRTDADGNPRELHIKQALDVCIKTKFKLDNSTACEYFTVKKFTSASVNNIVFTPENFYSVICLDGEGEIIHDNKIYEVKKGDSYFIPANMGKFAINKKSENFGGILSCN